MCLTGLAPHLEGTVDAHYLLRKGVVCLLNHHHPERSRKKTAKNGEGRFAADAKLRLVGRQQTERRKAT